MERIKSQVVKILRFLEKYTKTDMIYLAKGGFWLGIGQIVATGSAILTSIAFANLLAPETFGIYKYILSINSLLLITTLFGMDSAVTQSVSRGFEGTLNLGVKTKMKWGFWGTLASFCIALYYFYQGNYVLAIAFSITAIFMPFTESLDIYNSLLWGKKLFDIQTKYNIIKKCIALVSIIITIFLTRNLYIILSVYFLSIVLPNAYFLYRTNKIYRTNNDVDYDSMRYGKKLSIVSIVSILLTELDKILVFHYIGAVNLAIYSLALAPTDQIKGLLKNINSLAFPRFSNKSIGEIKTTIWSKVRILTFVVTLIVFVYIIFAPILYKLFFPKYLDSILYSQVLSVSLIPAVVAGFLYTIMESLKSEDSIFKYTIYGNIFGIIILFPLVYSYGIWGAILSKTLTRFIFMLYGTFLIKKQM